MNRKSIIAFVKTVGAACLIGFVLVCVMVGVVLLALGIVPYALGIFAIGVLALCGGSFWVGTNRDGSEFKLPILNLRKIALGAVGFGILVVLGIGILNSFGTETSCHGTVEKRVDVNESPVVATALFKDRHFGPPIDMPEIYRPAGSGLLANGFKLCSMSRLRSPSGSCTTYSSGLYATEIKEGYQLNTVAKIDRKTGDYKVDQMTVNRGPYGRKVSHIFESGACNFKPVFLPPWKSEPKACRVAGPEVRNNFDLDRAYPDRAVRRGIEGKVTVQYTVGVTGRVQSLKILHSDEPLYFDQAVKSEFKRMRWYPATNPTCDPIVSSPQRMTVTFFLG